jgi:uncharacterized protein YciI
MPSFAFLYSMSDDAGAIRRVVPEHVAYWRDAAPGGYRGGPFADRSGGLILFDAPDLNAAEAAAASDPFVREGVLRESRVREWLA